MTHVKICNVGPKGLPIDNNDKPLIYTRYVDDIYMKVKNENYLKFIKNKFILNSN